MSMVTTVVHEELATLIGLVKMRPVIWRKAFRGDKLYNRWLKTAFAETADKMNSTQEVNPWVTWSFGILFL